MTGAAYIPKAQREDWRTPAEVVELVRAALGGTIRLDPCSHPESDIGASQEIMLPWHDSGTWVWAPGRRERTIFSDGLEEAWHGTAYCNPPFGELRAWAAKCQREHQEHGAEVILLMPARTDTKAWHEHVATASAVCLWRGRLTFVGAPATCPFPVALVYWGPHINRFREVFGPHGMVFRP